VNNLEAIIICGTGRSGTSIFTKLIGCHSKIWSFRWESQIFSGLPGLADLVTTNSLNHEFTKFKKQVSGYLYKRKPPKRSYEAGLFEIISLEQLESLLYILENKLLSSSSISEKVMACRDFAMGLFLPAVIEKGAAVWCEKTPRNLLYADIISKILPKSKFIHVVRDGRDVLASILHNKFWPIARSSKFPETLLHIGKPNFDNALTYWNNMINIGIKQEKIIGPSRWLNVRMEDFVDNPNDSFNRIFDYLEIEGEPSFFKEISKYIKASKANRERWKSEFSKDQVDKFKMISFDNLVRYGYSV